MKARKTEIAMGVAFSDLERVGEEWNKMKERRIGDC